MALERHARRARRARPRTKLHSEDELRDVLARAHLGPPEPRLDWAAGISPGEWATYSRAIAALRGAGVAFMLGGGFAQATFTGRWRNTKDIDFYIHPHDRDRTVAVLSEAGFADYFNRLSYDRNWIYRSVRADMIVDIIWSMANQRAQVDPVWFERAGAITLRGEHLRVIPLEEFLWCKLYILQRDRCDWIDIFNVLYANGPHIDWLHLIDRVEDDRPLLQGLLAVYGWLHPERALRLPRSLREFLGLPEPQLSGGRAWTERARFLDSRAWFVGLRARGERLEV